MVQHDLPDDLFLIHPSADDDSPASPTLSFSKTPTVLLNFAANRFTRQTARDYQSQFGIGAMDWRMLVMLTRTPGSSVAHASRTIGIDKAAVSRCLQRLHKAGLVKAEVNGSDDRRKDWALTTAGTKLHDQILTVALARQRQLLDGFSQQEVAQFTCYLSRLLSNLDPLDAPDNNSTG